MIRTVDSIEIGSFMSVPQPPANPAPPYRAGLLEENSDVTAIALSARPFVAALCVAVVISSLLRVWIVVNRSTAFDTSSGVIRSVLGGTVALQIAITAAFFVAVMAALSALRADRLPSQRLQRLLGVFASVTVAVGLWAVLITIARRSLGSYELLLEAGALYLAINLVFAYWYWYSDHPLRFGVRLADQTIDYTQGIRFPEEAVDAGRSGRWTPNLTDYVYFTLVSSNALGAPEGHTLIGNRLKQLQIVHSVCMLFLFVIIVARAINTLE
jgi:hypothetical protein